MRLRLSFSGSFPAGRQIAFLALAGAVFLGLTRLAAADLEDVLAAKQLRVGVIASEAPPLVQTDARGAPSGLEIDFITEVARRMEVSLTFVRTARTPDELVAQVARGEVDAGIGQLTDSLEWAKSVRFSRPYLELHELRLMDRMAATRAGGATALSADRSAGVTAAAGSIVLPALQEEFGPRLTVLPTLAEAIDTVLAGKAAIVVADNVAGSRWLQAHPAAGLRLQVIPRADRRPGLVIAVHWKADDLQAWLNLCIEKCLLDGSLDALAAKHLGENRP